VATQTLARRLDLGVFFSDMQDLGAQLRDAACMARVRDSVWRQRHAFTFDHHADRLVEFFRRIIARREATSEETAGTGTVPAA
jgi:hypothetical protein